MIKSKVHCVWPNCACDSPGTDGCQNHIRATPPAATAAAQEPVAPSGYAYRYPDGFIRFSGGRDVNGSRPTEAIPYWFEQPPKGGDARAEFVLAVAEFRQAFVIAVGDKSPFAKIALEKIDAAIAAKGE